MSLADVNTEMAAAVAALKSGDYSAALLSATCAQGLLAGIPDSLKSGEEFRWRDRDIELFVSRIERLRKGSAGIQFSKVTYARPSS